MTVLGDLCSQAPVRGRGVPVAENSTWRLSVEVAMPSDPSSLLGSFELGTSALASFGWYDVTDRMRGVQIDRGGSPGDRPEPGTCLIELDNEDGSLSPWTTADYFLGRDNTYLGPGTLVRVVTHDYPGTQYYDSGKASDMDLLYFSTSEATVSGDELWFSFVNGNDQTSSSGYFNFDEDSIQVETAQFPATTSGYVRDCYFGLSDGGSNFVAFIWQESGVLACYDGSTTTEVVGSSHKHWRFRETVGFLYFETSFDGMNWEERKVIFTPAWMSHCYPYFQTNVTSAAGNLSAADGWHIKNVNAYQLATDWMPMFTGLVGEWDTSTQAIGQSSTALITAIDTISVLAAVDENAITPVGAGDLVPARIERLGDAANWQFDYALLFSPTAQLQATDMSMNRLAEMYLVADSTDAIVLSDKYGRLMCTEKELLWVDQEGQFFTLDNPYLTCETSPALGEVTYYVQTNIDDFNIVNNDDLLISKVTLARVGGSAVSYENTYISGRYQKRTYTRSDFITQNPGADGDLEYVADRILARADTTLRPDSITVDGKLGLKHAHFIIAMDVSRCVTIKTDDVEWYRWPICAYTVRILPLNEGELDMVADLRFDVGVNSARL